MLSDILSVFFIYSINGLCVWRDRRFFPVVCNKNIEQWLRYNLFIVLVLSVLYYLVINFQSTAQIKYFNQQYGKKCGTSHYMFHVSRIIDTHIYSRRNNLEYKYNIILYDNNYTKTIEKSFFYYPDWFVFLVYILRFIKVTRFTTSYYI